ncbi:MAG: winged helix-turn-helix domain-containing protein [Sphingobium sp.]|nr:winged helix-turn-helix domain-containing protein [Sphingobium sp.]
MEAQRQLFQTERADLASIAHALRGRGIALSLAAPSDACGQTRILTIGEDRILWQAADDPVARARAFSEGLDEVVGPWMDADEAFARILRRVREPIRVPTVGPSDIMCGDLCIRPAYRAIERAGKPVRLVAREYDLLLHLARQPGQPASRMDLLRAVWRLDFDPGTNRVEVHVSRLRGKIDRGFAWPMLRTVKGRGYALYPSPAG